MGTGVYQAVTDEVKFGSFYVYFTCTGKCISQKFLFQNSRIKGILKFIFDISYKYELYSMSATSNIEI